MEFKDIHNCNMLVDFLKERGVRHRHYHHYTNISSVLSLIKSGYWHLSLGDRMNDKQELTKGAIERWKNIFITSFAFGDNESIAMWGLYSIPWEDAVRITIPYNAMSKWLNSTSAIYRIPDKNNPTYEEIKQINLSLQITDVAYVSGSRGGDDGIIKWYDKKIILKQEPDLVGISDDPIITGYIKNEAWSFENEVRIRAEFNNNFRYDKIAIKTPDYVIDNLEIKAGPWMKKDIITRIEQELENNYNDLHVRHSYSAFHNLVELRNICDFCLHRNFIRAVE